MPNNENDWSRNREGSGRYENENRYNRSRESDYEGDDYNRQRNYGNQGGDFGSAGYNRNRDMGRGSDYESRGSYGNEMNRGIGGYGDDWNRGDNWNRGGDDWNRKSSDWNRGSDSGRGNDWDRGNDWNRGNDWSTGRGYSDQGRSGDYRERSGGERNRGDRTWWNRTKDEVSSWFGDDDADRRRRMDETRDEYRGKGPKGYTRSDERIREDINDRLSDDGQLDASDIEVSVSNCEVSLSGTVKDRWQKRRAEDLAEAISGVKNVENRLKVNQSADMSSSGGTQGNMGQPGNTSSYSSSGNSNRSTSPAKTS